MRKSSPLQQATTVDEYLERLPEKDRKALQLLRQQIRSAAPKAEELISYQIPSFKHHYMLVGFAAFKDHLSFFVMSGTALKPFEKELAPFKTATGTVQFTNEHPIPAALVKKLVKVRLRENEERWSAREMAKPKTAKLKTVITKEKSANEKDSVQVEAYVSQLKGQHREDVNALRTLMTGTNKKLSERIKWNAPSYYYKKDIVTFGPYQTHKLMLVFHHPAVVKIKSPLLEGNYKDRRLVHFESKEHAVKCKKELTRIVNEIVKEIEKGT